jgi:integrase
MLFDAPYVIERSGRPYFMMRIPTDLVEKFGVKYIRKSLKTTDPEVAKLLAENLAAKAKSAFALLRSGSLPDEQEKSLIAEYTFHPKGKPQPKPAMFTELFRAYFDENSPNWTAKTATEFQKQFERMAGILGNRKLDQYDRASCLALRTKLAKELEAKTTNKYLGLLSSIFRWGVRHEYTVRNPAEGMQLAIKKRPDQERKAYDLEDIERVMATLPSRSGDEPFKFWIPVIAMYSGMRREEICQLQVGDIRKVENVWCFDINGKDGKNLKTKSADRLVPVHSKLIDLGLLKFIESTGSRGNVWGFTQWKGIWGKKFGNWWSLYYSRRHVTTDPLKCFHSFRHLVADTLKQAGFQETLVGELLGHAQSGITFNRYGKKYLPPRLVEAVEAVRYP